MIEKKVKTQEFFFSKNKLFRQHWKQNKLLQCSFKALVLKNGTSSRLAKSRKKKEMKETNERLVEGK